MGGQKRPSKRWQAGYVGPDLAVQYAPTTFGPEIEARDSLAAELKKIESGEWTAPARRSQTLPPATFRCVRGVVAGSTGH